MSFFGELKRRSVFRMGVFYLLGAWVVLQIVDVLVGVIGLPDWTMRLVGLVLLLGLPLVLVLSWVYELTPEGIKKDDSVDATGHQVTVTPAQRMILIASIAAVMVGGYVLIDRFLVEQQALTSQTASKEQPPRMEPVVFAALPLEVHSEEVVSEEQIQEWQTFLRSRVSNWPDIRLAEQKRVDQLLGESNSPEQLSARLGLTHLLSGEVWYSDGEARFDLRIYDTQATEYVWTRSFNDPFFIDGEHQLTALSEQEIELDRFLNEEELTESTIGTDNALAYEAWWMARHYDDFEDPKTERLRWYNEAIMLDPEYAQAYTDLSRYWFVQTNGGVPWPDVREASESAALKALEIDPDNPEANANMSRVAKLNFISSSDPEERAVFLKQSLDLALKAVQLAPRNASIREDYARALNGERNWDEMINQLEIIFRYRPNAKYLREWKTSPLVWAGRVDEAEAYLAELKTEFPDDDWDYTDGAFSIHRAKGEYLEALEAQHPMMRINPSVWVQDYMDLLFDIGAVEAAANWANHIGAMGEGQGINFVWVYILSAMGHLGQVESQLSFINEMSSSVMNDDVKAVWRQRALYGDAVSGPRNNPGVAAAIADIEAACEQFETGRVAEVNYLLDRSMMSNARRCFVISARTGSNRVRLGEAVLEYFENRESFEPTPPGSRDTYDMEKTNLVYTLAVMGRADEAVAVLREIYDQGFRRPYHFRSFGVVPDLENQYNGLGSHLEFLDMFNELEARNAAIRSDIDENAPWLFDPSISSPFLDELAQKSAQAQAGGSD
jgi:tetratricopeptide (TPR) repeat protein